MSGQKFIKNTKNGPFLAIFRKPESCGQTVLPDGSILIGQKLVENVKIQKFKCDILTTSKMSYLVNKIATLFGHFSTIKSLSRID